MKFSRFFGCNYVRLAAQLALVLGFANATTGAFATSYNIIGVQDFFTGPSALIASYKVTVNGERVRVNTRIANIQNGAAGATGTFIDGVLNVSLITELGETVTLSSGTEAFQFEGAIPSGTNREFQQINKVNTVITLPAGGMAGMDGPAYTAPGGDYKVRFKGNDFGYTEALGPNSFGPNPDGSGTFLLTLWGEGPSLVVNGRRLGADIRLVMSPVPLPAAFLLFGSALVGLFGVRRRNQLANAA